MEEPALQEHRSHILNETKNVSSFVTIGETLNKVYYKEKLMKTQKEFLEWTKKNLGFSKSTTYEYIISYKVFSEIADNLPEKYRPPQYQSHCQLLSKVPTDKLLATWIDVCEKAPGGTITTNFLESYLSDHNLKGGKTTKSDRKGSGVASAAYTKDYISNASNNNNNSNNSGNNSNTTSASAGKQRVSKRTRGRQTQKVANDGIADYDRAVTGANETVAAAIKARDVPQTVHATRHSQHQQRIQQQQQQQHHREGHGRGMSHHQQQQQQQQQYHNTNNAYGASSGSTLGPDVRDAAAASALENLSLGSVGSAKQYYQPMAHSQQLFSKFATQEYEAAGLEHNANNGGNGRSIHTEQSVNANSSSNGLLTSDETSCVDMLSDANKEWRNTPELFHTTVSGSANLELSLRDVSVSGTTGSATNSPAIKFDHASGDAQQQNLQNVAMDKDGNTVLVGQLTPNQTQETDSQQQEQQQQQLQEEEIEKIINPDILSLGTGEELDVDNDADLDYVLDSILGCTVGEKGYKSFSGSIEKSNGVDADDEKDENNDEICHKTVKKYKSKRNRRIIPIANSLSLKEKRELALFNGVFDDVSINPKSNCCCCSTDVNELYSDENVINSSSDSDSGSILSADFDMGYISSSSEFNGAQYEVNPISMPKDGSEWSDGLFSSDFSSSDSDSELDPLDAIDKTAPPKLPINDYILYTISEKVVNGSFDMVLQTVNDFESTEHVEWDGRVWGNLASIRPFSTTQHTYTPEPMIKQRTSTNRIENGLMKKYKYFGRERPLKLNHLHDCQSNDDNDGDEIVNNVDEEVEGADNKSKSTVISAHPDKCHCEFHHINDSRALAASKRPIPDGEEEEQYYTRQTIAKLGGFEEGLEGLLQTIFTKFANNEFQEGIFLLKAEFGADWLTPVLQHPYCILRHNNWMRDETVVAADMKERETKLKLRRKRRNMFKRKELRYKRQAQIKNSLAKDLVPDGTTDGTVKTNDDGEEVRNSKRVKLSNDSTAAATASASVVTADNNETETKDKETNEVSSSISKKRRRLRRLLLLLIRSRRRSLVKMGMKKDNFISRSSSANSTPVESSTPQSTSPSKDVRDALEQVSSITSDDSEEINRIPSPSPSSTSSKQQHQQQDGTKKSSRIAKKLGLSPNSKDSTIVENGLTINDHRGTPKSMPSSRALSISGDLGLDLQIPDIEDSRKILKDLIKHTISKKTLKAEDKLPKKKVSTEPKENNEVSGTPYSDVYESYVMFYLGPHIENFVTQFQNVGLVPGFNTWKYQNANDDPHAMKNIMLQMNYATSGL